MIGRRALIAALALAPALIGCGDEGPETPTPPPIEPLLERFGPPDGVLDAAAAQALVEDAVEDVVTFAAVGVLLAELDAVVAGLDTATEDDEASSGLRAAPDGIDGSPPIGQSRHALDARAGAWARVTHLCPGADRSVVDPANGRLQLRTVLDDLVSDPQAPLIIWGEARACRLDTGDALATLDADITTAFLQDGSGELLVSLVGGLAEPEGLTEFGVELLRRADEYVLRRDVPGNGGFLVGLDALGGAIDSATLTDAVGEWRCTFDTAAAAGTCARGEERLSWP